MVKNSLNKWWLGLFTLLMSLVLAVPACASNDYADFFVQITDATSALKDGNEEEAKAILAQLQTDFAAVENHDSEAGQAVTKAMAVQGDLKESDLVAISKALLAFDQEQNPIDLDAEKNKLLTKLQPEYDKLQAAIDQQDIETVKTAFKNLNTIWTRNEGIVRDNAAHYGNIETAISFLNASTVADPVDFATIQSNFDAVKVAVQSFIDGDDLSSTTSENLTLADGIDLLKSALKDFQAGETSKASQTMKEFVTIWPTIEGDISTRDNALYTRVESESPVIMVKGSDKAYQDKLQALIDDLSAIDTDASYNFFDAALILLREGVEALLIVLALVSSLKATKQRKDLPWVYGGAVAGIAASVCVAYLLQKLFPTLAASSNREILEGFVGIVAVVLMFLIGIWLHSKASVKQWNDFMNRQMKVVTTSGSFISMFALSFLAVFREGAETILFYVGILPKITTSQLVLGGVIAVVALVIVALAMTFLTERIVAHRVFFYLTWLLYGLAFKMLGVSIHALQLTNLLPNHLIDGLPTVEVIGFYPSWETVAPQVIFVGLVVLVTLKNRAASHD
ncbi:FTR1 family iron permease [Streptococcus caprae]|uniref:FTR1 family protein n=1 Tax=Streptococcus caprae TaxID=1640501 RepID=A0ABV8CXC3_9STRE